MALTYTIQCDGTTTSFTLARAVTTKESLSLTIASGDDAGTTVPGSDYSFSPVNNVAQSVTINWPNAANYGTVGTPVDVTVAVYHNPGADPADTLLYSYEAASAMRPEMVGRDLEHIIDLIKMVIGGADLSTTSLGDQEDDIAALDVRVTAAEADIIALDARMDTAESDIDTAQADIIALEATDATHTGQLAGTTSSGLKTAFEASISSLQDQINSNVGLPTPVASGQAEAADSASPIQVLAVDTLGALEYIDLLAQVKNAPITDTGNYFTTDTLNAALQQLGASLAGGIVWVAGIYADVSLAALGGGTSSLTVATYSPTRPMARTGNFVTNTTVPQANDFCILQFVEDSPPGGPLETNELRVYLPSSLTALGYTTEDFEISFAAITNTTTGAGASCGTGLAGCDSAADGSYWILPNTGNDYAITIKRVRTI